MARPREELNSGKVFVGLENTLNNALCESWLLIVLVVVFVRNTDPIQSRQMFSLLFNIYMDEVAPEVLEGM